MGTNNDFIKELMLPILKEIGGLLVPPPPGGKFTGSFKVRSSDNKAFYAL